MTTITEDYVSFETAKLLKEKGFPQEYDVYHSMIYNEEDFEDEYEVQRMVLQTRLVKAGTLFSYPIGVPDPKCYCPTLQMAMKWLREVYKISIEVFYFTSNRDSGAWAFEIIKLPSGATVYGEYNKENYEQACEAAIRYCLKHLI